MRRPERRATAHTANTQSIEAAPELEPMGARTAQPPARARALRLSVTSTGFAPEAGKLRRR